MNLSQYLTTRLRELGLKRGDIPKLLGYTNPNKCLRNLDRLLEGDINQLELIKRLGESRLGGRPFEVVMTNQVKTWELEKEERRRVQELKERMSFVPHLHFIHERSVPSPIHVVCFIGVNHFKRLEIPDYILNTTDELTRLNLLDSFLVEYLRNPPDHRLTHSVFGKVVQILYRFEYDKSYVFDIQKGLFMDVHFGVPRMGIGRLKLRSGGILS